MRPFSSLTVGLGLITASILGTLTEASSILGGDTGAPITDIKTTAEYLAWVAANGGLTPDMGITGNPPPSSTTVMDLGLNGTTLTGANQSVLSGAPSDPALATWFNTSIGGGVTLGDLIQSAASGGRTIADVTMSLIDIPGLGPMPAVTVSDGMGGFWYGVYVFDGNGNMTQYNLTDTGGGNLVSDGSNWTWMGSPPT